MEIGRGEPGAHRSLVRRPRRPLRLRPARLRARVVGPDRARAAPGRLRRALRGLPRRRLDQLLHERRRRARQGAAAEGPDGLLARARHGDRAPPRRRARAVALPDGGSRLRARLVSAADRGARRRAGEPRHARRDGRRDDVGAAPRGVSRRPDLARALPALREARRAPLGIRRAPGRDDRGVLPREDRPLRLGGRLVLRRLVRRPRRDVPRPAPAVADARLGHGDRDRVARDGPEQHPALHPGPRRQRRGRADRRLRARRDDRGAGNRLRARAARPRAALARARLRRPAAAARARRRAAWRRAPCPGSRSRDERHHRGRRHRRGRGLAPEGARRRQAHDRGRRRAADRARARQLRGGGHRVGRRHLQRVRTALRGVRARALRQARLADRRQDDALLARELPRDPRGGPAGPPARLDRGRLLPREGVRPLRPPRRGASRPLDRARRDGLRRRREAPLGHDDAAAGASPSSAARPATR